MQNHVSQSHTITKACSSHAHRQDTGLSAAPHHVFMRWGRCTPRRRPASARTAKGREQGSGSE